MKNQGIIGKSLSVIVIFICLSVIFMIKWLLDNFGGLSIELLIFNLHVPLKGTPACLFLSCFIYMIVIPVLLIIIFFYLKSSYFKRHINSIPVFFRRIDVLAFVITVISLIYSFFYLNLDNLAELVLKRPVDIKPMANLIVFNLLLIVCLVFLIISNINYRSEMLKRLAKTFASVSFVSLIIFPVMELNINMKYLRNGGKLDYEFFTSSYVAPHVNLILCAIIAFLFILFIILYQFSMFRRIFTRTLRFLIELETVAIEVFLFLALCLYININWGDVFDYVYSPPSTLYEKYYIDPKSVSITFPEKKRNLILIYLESMETTYQSEALGGAMDKNYIPELTSLAKEYVNFSGTSGVGGAIQVFGTSWTMAAGVASSSGLPLKIPLANDEYAQDNMSKYKTFLPGSIALGNILQKNGYYNVLMCSNDAEFSGTDTYYYSHGRYRIMDSNYFEAIGAVPGSYNKNTSWGFKDSLLFELAKKEL